MGTLLLVLLTVFLLHLLDPGNREMWYDQAFAVPYAEREPGCIILGLVTPVEGAAADIDPLLCRFFLHGWMRIGRPSLVVRFPSDGLGMLGVSLASRVGPGLSEPDVGPPAAVPALIFSRREWFDILVALFSVLSHGPCFDRLPSWRAE